MAGMPVLFDKNDMSSWYFGGLSRQEATNLLMNESESGVFLVRDSKTIHGDYVLCVKENDRVANYIINRVESHDGQVRYRIGNQLFADMPTLLDFYRLHLLDTTPIVRPLSQHNKVNVVTANTGQMPVIEIVLAKFDFVARDPDDLPFKRGEHLFIINKHEEKWWTARNIHGRVGSIPEPYVQTILDASASPLTQTEALLQVSGKRSNEMRAQQPLQQHCNNITTTCSGTPSTNGTSATIRNNMQRTLPAMARVRQSRVPNAYDSTALKLHEGDIVKVTKMNINGQWEGELNGKIGHFPFTHVEFIDDIETVDS